MKVFVLGENAQIESFSEAIHNEINLKTYFKKLAC